MLYSELCSKMTTEEIERIEEVFFYLGKRYSEEYDDLIVEIVRLCINRMYDMIEADKVLREIFGEKGVPYNYNLRKLLFNVEED